MARPDHYVVLGVARTASRLEIRNAFRRLARTHHPDAAGADPAAEREFKRIARAWEVLGDARRRRAYDARLHGRVFEAPGVGGPQSFAVDQGPLYHMDLGHHSDFYQAGDPLTVREAAALVARDAGWLRRSIRTGRLPATRGATGYLLRRRDVERLDRTARRRRPADPTTDESTRPDAAGEAEASEAT